MKLLSRDENKLFAFNKFSKKHVMDNEKYKIRYENVKLKKGLNKEFQIHSILYCAVVCWKTFNIQVFRDKEDEQHNVISYEGKFEIEINCDTNMTHILNFECFVYLNRGHSRFHKECTCEDIRNIGFALQRIGLEGINYDQRLKDLGYPMQKKSGICKVKRERIMRSIDEIELELGVFQINKNPSANLFHNMYNSTLFQVIKRGLNNYVHCSLCCIPPSIQDAHDIFKAVKVYHPEPFVWEYPVRDTNLIGNLHSQYLLNQNIINQVRFLYSTCILIVEHQKREEEMRLPTNGFTFFYYPDFQKADPIMKEMWRLKGVPKSRNVKTICYREFIPMQECKKKQKRT